MLKKLHTSQIGRKIKRGIKDNKKPFIGNTTNES